MKLHITELLLWPENVELMPISIRFPVDKVAVVRSLSHASNNHGSRSS